MSADADMDSLVTGEGETHPQEMKGNAQGAFQSLPLTPASVCTMTPPYEAPIALPGSFCTDAMAS